MTAVVHQFHIMQSNREIEERIESAEIEAGDYFNMATKAQKAEFDAVLNSLIGMTGPKWNRARDAARAKWRDDTAEARKLFDATVECLLDTGEVSDELSDAWTALIEREEVAQQMAAE